MYAGAARTQHLPRSTQLQAVRNRQDHPHESSARWTSKTCNATQAERVHVGILWEPLLATCTCTCVCITSSRVEQFNATLAHVG